MFRHIQKAIAEEYSGIRAKDYVADIVRYHRIQASPGFRAAAEHCRDVLEGFGVPATVLSFPANEATSYWSRPMFQEWDVSEATLHLIEPTDQARKLADFAEVKCSLIQRSAPVENLEAEIVLLEDGEDNEDYKGLDLKDRIVLTKGDPDRVRELAVNRRGAAGIIFDGMREIPPVRQRIDMPDVVEYRSFWWQPTDIKCFGFVLSPREGDSLRGLIRSRRREGKPPVMVRAHVTSRLYDGHMEVVSALIPGETDEKVVVIAHLCHPQPSANDNASGTAAALELTRALHRLIASGELPRPRRAIQILLVPEMTGTYAYLSAHEDKIDHMVAGINLDMVGQNQDICRSVFIVERTPEAMPSFAATLLERLREEWLRGAQNPGASGSSPLFRHAVTPFSGGSDHYILSDPSVGVPTPMLIQWPDRYWHTSEDTLDKVDPRMLAVLGGLATTYAYFVANAGEREAAWLGHEMAARFQTRLARTVQNALTDASEAENAHNLAQAAENLEKKARFVTDRYQEATQSLLRLAPHNTLAPRLKSEADSSLRRETERAKKVLFSYAQDLGLEDMPSLPPKELDEWEQQALGIVPSRKFRGPVPSGFHLHKLAPEERETVYAWFKEYGRLYHRLGTVANYWVDGERTVAEIADLVELETEQRNVQLLVRHYNLLAKLGLMALRTVSENRPLKTWG